MKKYLSWILACAVLVIGGQSLASWADPAHAEVAQITLSRGRVMVWRDGDWRPVRIFSAVRAGEKIQMMDDDASYLVL